MAATANMGILPGREICQLEADNAATPRPRRAGEAAEYALKGSSDGQLPRAGGQHG